jgi:ribose 5-phosphate isomerase B
MANGRGLNEPWDAAALGCRTPGSVHCFEYATLIGKCQFRQAWGVRIVVGADDEGAVADAAVSELRSRGHDVTVVERDQWPNVAERVARAVASGEADQGMLFCWTGTGTSMAANKVPGVRAALAWEPWIAEGARKWNDANVLVMSLKRVEPETARAIVDAWLSVSGPDPDEAANIARLSELDCRE